MKTQDALILGLVAAGAYVLWKSTSAIKKGVDSAVTAIAKGFVNLTSGEVVPLGSVQLPNGQWIPVSSLAVKPGAGASAVFSYNGVNYTINGPSDANGNWTAQATGASATVSNDAWGVLDSGSW